MMVVKEYGNQFGEGEGGWCLLMLYIGLAQSLPSAVPSAPAFPWQECSRFTLANNPTR